MATRTTISRAALLVLLGSATNAHAVGLGLTAGLMHFDYEETGIAGETLNQETGFLPGFGLALSQPHGNFDHHFELAIYGGAVDYDGQTQGGQPHQTTTNQGIYRLQYRLDWSPETIDGGFYGTVYWQNWDRDIQPNAGVSGLFERYQWWSIEAGAVMPLMRRDTQSLVLELGVLATFNGTILVDLSSAGYGEPVLDLGNSLGFSSELRYEIDLDNNSLHLGIAYRAWEFGRSNTATVSNGVDVITVTEPDSTTAQTTLFASYIHRF